jgi:hypothetical protein
VTVLYSYMFWELEVQSIQSLAIAALPLRAATLTQADVSVRVKPTFC